MNKKLMTYVVTGAMAIGLLGGASYQGIAEAQTNAPAPSAVTSTVTTQSDKQNINEQQPMYQGTIKVANSQDNAKDNEKNVKDNEAQESAKLASLAKITLDQAKTAALKVVPGTVTKVSLDNENGYLVYSVEIRTNTGLVDVKVDAGNGAVLAQDKGQDNEKSKEKVSEGEKTNATDNDTVQLEQQGEN